MSTLQLSVGLHRYLAVRVEDRATQAWLAARGLERVAAPRCADILARVAGEPDLERLVGFSLRADERGVGELGGVDRAQQLARVRSRVVLFRARHRPLAPWRTGESAVEAEVEQRHEIVEAQDWIEIVLHDLDGEPVAGARYELTLPDGRVIHGRTDRHGLARHEGVPSGACSLSFTAYDGGDWDHA